MLTARPADGGAPLMSPARTKCSGFTLLELLVALAVIVGVVAAVPLLGLPGSARATHKAQVATLVRELRALRAQSVRDGTPKRLIIESDGNGYRVGDDSKRLPSAHKIQAMTEVAFYPDGTATETRLFFTSASQSTEIHVDGLLGVVRVVEIEQSN